MNKNQKNYVLYESVISIALNTVLFGVKIFAGIVSNSAALIADGWHTLSDSLSSIVLLIGDHVARQPRDEKHPFGHERAQSISALVISFLLAVIAYMLLSESIRKLGRHETANFGTFAISVTIASILVKEVMAQYAFYCARKGAGGEAMRAEGWHHRSDALSSLLILVGIFLNRYYWWIDGAMGIAIAGLFVWMAFDIFMKSSTYLLGTAPDSDLIERVLEICEDLHPGVHAHHFHLHSYGGHRELTFHVRLPGKMPLSEAHALMSAMERDIRKQTGIEATIHCEPQQ